jgi:hypothetical protein
MRLYFIGGASGSGKTTVMPHLKELLGDGIAVYDFDDIGVPEDADKKWRQESTEKWLQKLLKDGKDTCLLGQIVLGEILACPSAKQIGKVNFCLLDVSDFERIQRLKKRNTYGADQNMLNWSAWLRMHNQDPQWTPHVIQEDASSIMDFRQFNNLASYKEVANVKIIDTTDLASHEVVQGLVDWVRSFDDAPFHVVKVQPHEVDVIESEITSYNNSQARFTQKSGYRSKTPTVMSIFQRRLKPGKTFEDFQKAHLPRENAKKDEMGYQLDFFAVPTRVINAVSGEDPDLVISIGMSYGTVTDIYADVIAKAQEESLPGRRYDKLDEVCDDAAPLIIAFVAADNDYGGQGIDYKQTALAKVTPELIAAVKSMNKQDR